MKCSLRIEIDLDLPGEFDSLEQAQVAAEKIAQRVMIPAKHVDDYEVTAIVQELETDDGAFSDAVYEQAVDK